MRRIHITVGILGVIAFLLSGQLMAHHHPGTSDMPADLRMMYVSRHIYLLGAALVNVTIGVYLHAQPIAWRRVLQHIGSLLTLLSPFFLAFAFLVEPPLGVGGRSWRSFFGLIGLFIGVMSHFIANAGAPRIDTAR